jgi:hypothetical protein
MYCFGAHYVVASWVANMMLARQLCMLLTVLAIAQSTGSAHSSDVAVNSATRQPDTRSDSIDAAPGELHVGVKATAAVPRLAVPRIASEQQGSQQSTRHLTHSQDRTKDATGTAAAARSSSGHDHKPLFPIGGLEIAVLVIAGVVLFIAAGVLLDCAYRNVLKVSTAVSETWHAGTQHSMIADVTLVQSMQQVCLQACTGCLRVLYA